MQFRLGRTCAILAVLGGVSLQGCEDDPILSPQTGTKAPSGSYGNIAVTPPAGSTIKRALGSSRSDSLTQETPASLKNPELF